MDRHEKIDSMEFAARNMKATKTFFSALFGWTFTEPSGNKFAVWSDQGLEEGSVNHG